MTRTLRIWERARRWPVAGCFSFGVTLGAALVYVLWRRRSAMPLPPEAAPKSAPLPPARRPASREIDITESALAEGAEASPEASAERLEAIRGIGPKFAGRLHAAGIHTFEALAAQSPERLREIVQAQPWQKIEPEAWIAEASRLARA